MTTKQTTERIEQFTSYDLFIALLSILSIINVFLYLWIESETIEYVVITMDKLLSLIFFIDFSKRFITAPSKRTYFFKQLGWADLLASLPFPQFKILRLFRIVKAYGIIGRVGVRNIVRGIIRNRASSALYLIMFLIIMLLEFGSLAILHIEQSNEAANITSASDALWWVYVTITTVGYGDQYPVTNLGRLVGVVVMFVGVGLFGVLTGFLANTFLPSNDEAPASNDEMKAIKKDIEEIKSLLKDKNS